MKRYTAPFGFALVAIWVAIIFALVAGQSAPKPAQHTTTQSNIASR
jgi:hypothetical protein